MIYLWIKILFCLMEQSYASWCSSFSTSGSSSLSLDVPITTFGPYTVITLYLNKSPHIMLLSYAMDSFNLE